MRSIHECRKVEIEIKRVKFSANLIVINSAGLDVILGMNWLSKNHGQIDCARKAITLTSPLGFQVEMVPKLEHPHLYALNGEELPDLSEVPVVCEFPDVFPEELPGMPPSREIEFVIELQPGTAPISRIQFLVRVACPVVPREKHPGTHIPLELHSILAILHR